MKAKEIFNDIVKYNFRFGALTKAEFVREIRNNFQVSNYTANKVADMTGNW